MFSVWPIERIIKEYHEDESKDFVGFADWLVHSHAIGFVKRHMGIFKSYDLENPVADSFVEAMLLINTDSARIY